MPLPLSQEEGLLAFIYDAYTKPDVAAAFKDNPTTVMAKYKLTVKEQNVIWATGLNMDKTVTVNADAQLAVKNGGVPVKPASGEDLVDVKYANAGPMATLGAMLVTILSQEDPFEFTW